MSFLLALFNFTWPLWYIAPWLIAKYVTRQSPAEVKKIFWVNLLLGWTIVMWLVTMWMAVMGAKAYDGAGSGPASLPPGQAPLDPAAQGQQRGPCPTCGGSGQMTCQACGGSAGTWQQPTTEHGAGQFVPCSRCLGSGRVQCMGCGGTGRGAF
jgi:hypothetical protein